MRTWYQPALENVCNIDKMLEHTTAMHVLKPYLLQLIIVFIIEVCLTSGLSDNFVYLISVLVM